MVEVNQANGILMSDKIFIIGAGRFGTHLASRLSELGEDVVLTDRDARVVQDRSEAGFRSMRLDADDEQDLRAAGVVGCDTAVVAIGENMQASILCTMILKEIGVAHVVARAINDKHAQILDRLGADHVVSPNKDSAVRLAEQLHADSSGERVPLAGAFQLGVVKLGPQLAGKTLGEVEVEAKYKLQVALLVRTPLGRAAEAHRPKPALEMNGGDLLYLVGKRDDLNEFETDCGLGD